LGFESSLNKESNRDYVFLDSSLRIAFKGLPYKHNIIICFDHWYVKENTGEGVEGGVVRQATIWRAVWGMLIFIHCLASCLLLLSLFKS